MKQIKSKIIITIIMLFTLFGCKKELINDNKFIQNLSNDIDFELPMINESLMIFIKKKDIIYVTNLRQLYLIKEKKYEEINRFDDFLIEVINNDFLSRKELETHSVYSFKPNKEIIEEFNKRGIKYLRDTYCDSLESKKNLYIKNNLEMNKKKTLMYLFFKNNYYIGEDDYLGKYIIIDKN